MSYLSKFDPLLHKIYIRGGWLQGKGGLLNKIWEGGQTIQERLHKIERVRNPLATMIIYWNNSTRQTKELNKPVNQTRMLLRNYTMFELSKLPGTLLLAGKWDFFTIVILRNKYAPFPYTFCQVQIYIYHDQSETFFKIPLWLDNKFQGLLRLRNQIF